MDFIERMLQMSAGERLPLPADYQAPELAALLFTIWAGGMGLAVLPWTLRKWLREQDPVPLLFIPGGLIASLLEPMLDLLGHLWWPANLPGPVFFGYGLPIPYLVPPCYMAVIAMTGYWAYLRMKRGLDLKGVFSLWLLLCLMDIVVEIPGTASGAYTYYGDASFKIFGFPLVWAALNGTTILGVGFLLWLVEPHLKGSRRLWLMLVPVMAMSAVYGMLAWPYFMSLNWPMPWIATRLLSLLSIGLAVVVVRFMAAVVATRAPILAESPRPRHSASGYPA